MRKSPFELFEISCTKCSSSFKIVEITGDVKSNVSGIRQDLPSIDTLGVIKH